MSQEQYAEFAIRAVLYRDGVPMSPSQFYGTSGHNLLRAAEKVSVQLLDDQPELMREVIDDLCEVIKSELLRAFCGVGE